MMGSAEELQFWDVGGEDVWRLGGSDDDAGDGVLRLSSDEELELLSERGGEDVWRLSSDDDAADAAGAIDPIAGAKGRGKGWRRGVKGRHDDRAAAALAPSPPLVPRHRPELLLQQQLIEAPQQASCPITTVAALLAVPDVPPDGVSTELTSVLFDVGFSLTSKIALSQRLGLTHQKYTYLLLLSAATAYFASRLWIRNLVHMLARDTSQELVGTFVFPCMMKPLCDCDRRRWRPFRGGVPMWNS